MLKENYFVIGASREGNVKEIKSEAFYPLKLDLTIPTSIREAQKKLQRILAQLTFSSTTQELGRLRYPKTENKFFSTNVSR